jgi:hypothetical protein
MRTCLTISIIFIIATLTAGQGFKPKDGFVPDSVTAVKIAEAVLAPVYGEKQIESEEPFTAKIKADIWTVSGTLHCPDGKGGITTNCVGGVVVVKISKINGRIVSMIHYQ